MELNTEDIKFIRMMIPHHEDAVEMAKRVLGRGLNEEVKKMALDIVNGQSQEINRFEAILKEHGLSVETDKNERMGMKM